MSDHPDTEAEPEASADAPPDHDEPTPSRPEADAAERPLTSEASGEARPPARARRWRRLLRPAAIVAAVIIAFLVGRGLDDAGPSDGPTAEAEHGAHAPSDATQWTCSMHPQIRMSEPGQCPICGMDLVPMAADAAAEEHAEAEAGRTITLSPRAQALAELRTTPVVRTEPRAEIRLLGRVDYDETRLHMITPWTSGRIDQLHVRVTGAKVRKGQVVATLYSPEVYAAMRDLVIAAKQAKTLTRGLHGSADLATAALESARERLRLLGVSKGQIEQIERSGDAPKNVRVTSAYGGTVLERKVEEGDYVSTGTALYHLADLSQVWVQIDAYESDLPHLRVGQPVTVEVSSLPDERLEGKVAFIDPVVDARTRTARVRVEIDNEHGELRPGMFAEAVIDSELGYEQSHLVVPTSAVLFTGRRSVVYVAVPGRPGTYALREVRLGPKAGPVYPVLAGLSEGERVVSHGAFVVDADLQLAGGRSMMTLPGDEDEPEEAVPLTPEALAALAPVMQAYVDAQESLAEDDFAAARRHLGIMADVANEVVMTGPERTREAWSDLASSLVGHARHAAQAEAEGEVRLAFERLGTGVLGLLRAFGNPLSVPVRVAYCPMAFDSSGAQWAQTSEVLQNPYYGPAMLRCGEVRATLLPGERLAASPEPAASPAPSAPAGHQH